MSFCVNNIKIVLSVFRQSNHGLQRYSITAPPARRFSSHRLLSAGTQKRQRHRNEMYAQSIIKIHEQL